MSVIGWVKDNAHNIARYTGGVIAIGGIVGETLLAGEYNPSKWIGPGALTYAAGDAIDFYRTYAREKLDKGTKIKLTGKGVKTVSSGFLGLANVLNPNLLQDFQDLQTIVGYIGGSFGGYGIGQYLQIKGQKIKEKISPYFRASGELKDVAKSLENEKKPMSQKELKERLQQIEENLPNS